MPRKRRVPKLKTRRLTWGDLTISEMMNFWNGDSPDRGWEEYLASWAAMREEALVEWEEQRAFHLDHSRKDLEKRKAMVATDSHDQHLLDHAWRNLAEDETRELFAEVQYQRALKGLQPHTSDEWCWVEHDAQVAWLRSQGAAVPQSVLVEYEEDVELVGDEA